MLRTCEAAYLTTGEIKKYLARNDLALLTVGCTEMHGEHAPLSCDTIIDEAFTRLFTTRAQAVCFPPVHYAFTGATSPFPGTVSIPLECATDYLKNILRALFRGGFRRVIVVGSHGPHGFFIPYVLRSLFEETADAVAVHCSPSNYLEADDIKRIWRNDSYWLGENGLLLGAAKYLGLEKLIDPKRWSTKENTGSPHPSLKKLRRAKLHVPYHFSEPNQHLAPLSGLDYARGYKMLELAVKRALPMVKDLASWRDYVKKQRQAEKRKGY